MQNNSFLHTSLRFIITFILLLAFSYTKAEIKTSFTKIDNQTEDVYKIDSSKFTPFKDVLNKGLNSGFYCLKISGLERESIVILKTSRVSDTHCFQNNREIELSSNSVYNSFDVKSNDDVFIIMNCKREVVVPVSIINKKEYNICVLKTSFYNGIYYGTVLLLFIITLLVYYKLKKKPFLYYSFVLLFKSLVLFFHDNLFHVFFIKNSSNFAYEIIVHFLLVYFEFWFVYYYLNFKKHLPWTKKNDLYCIYHYNSFIYYIFYHWQLLFYFCRRYFNSFCYYIKHFLVFYFNKKRKLCYILFSCQYFIVFLFFSLLCKPNDGF